MTTSPYILEELARQHGLDLLREAELDRLAGMACAEREPRFRRGLASIAALATRIRSRERGAEISPAAA